MIRNPRRRKRIWEFYDQDHPLMEEYYDLLDRKLPIRRLKNEMKKLIAADPSFLDPYLVTADILMAGGKEKEAKNILRTAYEKAMKRIVDKDGNWPKKMSWGRFVNRHIIRAIERWAFELWSDGKTAEALEIFRNLLRTNPDDNIGARYSILAIRLGLSSTYQERFATSEPQGFIDANKISAWFERHSKKFPEEFGWWWKKVKSWA